jgi:hypothetical protein
MVRLSWGWPVRRAEDSLLMMLIELVLVLTYTCVLLIKTCYSFPDACSSYGFGHTASGDSRAYQPSTII